MEVKKRGRKAKDAAVIEPPIQPATPKVQPVKPEIKVIRAQPITSRPNFVVPKRNTVTLVNTKSGKRIDTGLEHAQRMVRKYPKEFKIL